MTGSGLQFGLIQGLASSDNFAGGDRLLQKEVYEFLGNPSGILTGFISGIAIDVLNGSIYMNISGTNNSNWIALGSVKF